jgi:hypothetical protein
MSELNSNLIEKYLQLCEDFGIVETPQEKKELKGMIVSTLLEKTETEITQEIQKMIKALYD